MLGKILETLYAKVFINIIVSDAQSTVYVESVSKGVVLSSEQEVFKTSNINTEMFSYISEHIKQSPFHYISILDKSPKQGAVPSCENIENYVKSNTVNSICVSNSWAYYTPKDDIKDMKYDYQTIGLDYIFSPFSILSKFFKDKINDQLAIFLLIEKKHISLSVFDKSELLFAEYLDMQKDLEDDGLMIDISMDDEDEISLDIGGIDLDDLDATTDDMGGLEDFSDIEELDGSDDIDEFAEAKDIQEITHQEEKEDVSTDDMNEDYQRFVMIQDAISTFYNDDKYKSEFIEHIYIADSIGVSNDLKKYLEEEIFLSVFIRKIELDEELCEMAKAELG